MGALGVGLAEGLAFVRLADPLVDLWDVTVGSIAVWSHDSGPSRFFAEGWQLEWTGRVREATAKPIVGVGRLTDPDVMADVIESGVWDLIGAARPSIADPFLPRKIEEGRYDEIRECIGCNVCISKSESAPPRLHAERDRRRGAPPRLASGALRAGPMPTFDVLVVGGGPAGMECALTPRASAACARAAGRARPGDGRAPRPAPAPPRPRPVGPRDGLPHGSAQAPGRRRS